MLNLLCDPTARTAFELDPEGALSDAGLGDITAADVQEVIPLVIGYAPVEGIGSRPATDQLPTDVDVAGAVRQLQTVPQHLTLGTPYPSTDFNAAAVGAVTGGQPDPLNLDGGAILPATTSTMGSVVDGVGTTVDGVVNVDVPLPGQTSWEAGPAPHAGPASPARQGRAELGTRLAAGEESRPDAAGPAHPGSGEAPAGRTGEC